MVFKAGDKVYFGWDAYPSEVVEHYKFGVIEIRKTNPHSGHQWVEIVNDPVLLHPKNIYQRLAELEKGKDNG